MPLPTTITALPPEKTAWRSAIEKFAAVQTIDLHVPTTDGRELLLTRYTEPEPELALLLHKLKFVLPGQPVRPTSHGSAIFCASGGRPRRRSCTARLSMPRNCRRWSPSRDAGSPHTGGSAEPRQPSCVAAPLWGRDRVPLAKTGSHRCHRRLGRTAKYRCRIPIDPDRCRTAPGNP